jgi:hypothetical protein
MYRETQWTTDYPSVLEIVTTLFPSRMPYYISCPASALTTVLILRRNIHENRASEPQRDGVGEMTLPAPSVAHSQKKKLTKSPTTHNLKSRRNGVYFANSPLPIQPSTEQLTTSPSVDEIDEEQTVLILCHQHRKGSICQILPSLIRPSVWQGWRMGGCEWTRLGRGQLGSLDQALLNA